MQRARRRRATVRSMPGSRRRLPLAFYRRPALEVAPDLLGRTLCRRLPDGTVLRGRLVEVEAYTGPDDRASHAHRGRTQRNAPMFEAGGVTYVYLIYGMYHCLNVVTGTAGHPDAVLLRAASSPDGRSASGPGRLARAFHVDRTLSGLSLAGPTLWLEQGEPVSTREVVRTPRIGVDYAGAWARRLFRFTVARHPDVSGPAALNRRARQRRSMNG